MEWIRLPLIHPAAFCQEIEMDELIMTCMQIYPIMAEARKFHIMGVTGDSHRFNPRNKGLGKFFGVYQNSTNVHHVTFNTPMKASRTEVLISIGGCDRPGGYNSPYVESWHPQTKEWTQMAKLPNFTKTEYAVCNIKNHIIVTGGRIHQKEVWIYQVTFLRTSFRAHF